VIVNGRQVWALALIDDSGEVDSGPHLGPYAEVMRHHFEFLTADQAAEELAVGKSVIFALVKAGTCQPGDAPAGAHRSGAACSSGGSESSTRPPDCGYWRTRTSG
jgi:hypothetical protein